MAKTRPHENEISLGENQWLPLGSIDFGQWSTAIEMDPILDPIIQFLESLQIHCVAECCGIDAFAFWPSDISKVIESFNDTQRRRLSSDLARVAGHIAELPGEIVTSHCMIQGFRKVVFLQLLEHLQVSIEIAV